MHYSFFTSKLTDALGWTLLHALWQGTLIALLMAMALLLLNQRSAQVRYVVAVSALGLTVAMGAVTFCRLYFTAETPVAALSSLNPGSATLVLLQDQSLNSISAEVKTPDSWESLSAQWIGYFERNAPLVVILWVLGILVLSLRFMGGLLYVQRLKYYKTQAIGAEWTAKMEALSQQLGLPRAVQLMESALVKVPMAIGYFKPVVLLPVGTFTGLTPSQIEAILTHELAHILRNDYWVNIFQSIVEILFFFHPAVWWMSGIVRQEREYCCDDIAVQHSGDNLTFAQALTNLEVMQAAPQLALSASGNRGSLLVRVQRLLQQNPQKPTFHEGMLASGVLLLCLVAISASAFTSLNQNSNENVKAQNSIAESIQTQPVDSTAAKTTYYSTFTDTNKVVREIVIVKDKKGNVTDVTVDGRKLSGKELKNYRQVIKQKLTEAKEDDERIYQGREYSGLFPPAPVPPVAPVPPADAPAAPLPPVPPMFEDDLEGRTLQIAPLKYLQEREAKLLEQRIADLQLGKEGEAMLRQHLEEAVKLNELQDLEYIQLQIESLNKSKSATSTYRQQLNMYKEELTKRTKRIEEKLKYLADESQKDQEAAMKEQEKAMKEHAKAMAEHDKAMEEHKKAMEKHAKFMKLLATELKKDGLITDEKSYSIRITNKKLYINEKEQPDSVFQKYKELIKRETGDNIEKWSDKQQMNINNNWRDTNTDEAYRESIKRQTGDQLYRRFLWNPMDLLKKAEQKEGC